MARSESADKDVPLGSFLALSQRIKLGGTMGRHREGTGTIVGREAILRVLETYNPSALRIAMIGLHSALDVCDGAVEEGFPTLVICEKGRATPYARYFRALRDKEGHAVRGMVDEAIVLSKFQEVLNEKMQDRLRKANAVFIPNRSFTSYCDLDEIERTFRVPLFGSRNLRGRRSGTKNAATTGSSRKPGFRRRRKSTTRRTSMVSSSSSCITRSRSSSGDSSPRRATRNTRRSPGRSSNRASSRRGTWPSLGSSDTSSGRSSTSISSIPRSKGRERSSNSSGSTGGSRRPWTATCASRRISR